MKKLLLILTLQGMCMTCLAQSIMIETQHQLNTDFSKYKTYTFASQVDQQLDEGYFFLNDLMLKTEIRNAVDERMTSFGFNKTAKAPDFIINFRVFDSPTRIKGTRDFGDTFWSDIKVRQPEDTTSYMVRAGTLFISFIDRKNSNIIWQGFASGLIDNNEFVKDENKIKAAVHMLLDKYEQHRKK